MRSHDSKCANNSIPHWVLSGTGQHSLFLARERRQVRVLCHLSVDYAPDSQRICVLQFFRQRLVGKSLIANRPRKSYDCPRAYRCGTPVRSGRIRASMHHGVTDLNSSGKAIEHKPPNFAFENRDEIGEVAEIRFRAMNRGRKVAFESAGNFKNLIAARVAHEKCCRTKYLRIQLRAEKSSCVGFKKCGACGKTSHLRRIWLVLPQA